MRYVPYGRMRKDEDDNFLGPYPNAFEVGSGHDYLSVTWCEYFVGSPDEQLRCSVEALRASALNVKSKACFCIADIPSLLATVWNFGRAARAVYYPEDDNPAHAGVFGIAPDDAQLLERLASEVWSSYLTKDTADALPTSACTKSDEID